MNKRGIGIPENERFQWTKQPNGKYTIFSVPVFRTYRKDIPYVDKKTGEEKYLRQEVSPEDLQAVVNNFEIEKRDHGNYPRIHISHHANGTTENMEPSGYMDFFELKTEEEVLYLYSDLIEIPERIFEDILNDKYPRRSVEHNEEDEKINSVALLSSREPFFSDLGLLNEKTLYKKPLVFEEKAVMNFQKRSEFLTWYQKEKGVRNMSWLKPKLKKYSDEENYPEKDKTDFMDGEETENMQDGEEPESIESKLQKFMDECTERFARYDEALGEKETSNMQEEEEKPLGLEPSTGSYQKEFSNALGAALAPMQEQLKGVSLKLFQMEQGKVDDEISQQIRTYSRISGKNFENIHANIQKYEGKKNKLVYLKEKINESQAYNNHYSNDHPAMNLVKNAHVPVDDLEKKYQKESPKMKNLIGEMIRDYQDNHDSKEVKIYGSCENWVDHHLKQEKKTPNYYMKNIRA